MKFYTLLFLVLVIVAVCESKKKVKKTKKVATPNNVLDFLKSMKTTMKATKTNAKNKRKTKSKSAAFSRGTDEGAKDDQKFETFGFESEEIVPFTQSCGREAEGEEEKEENKDGNSRELKYTKLESCCLTHRNCPLVISSNRSRWGVTNNVAYTIYDCKCDDAYANCLKNIKKTANFMESGVAWLVGKGYFDIYKTPCLELPDGVNLDEEEKAVDEDEDSKGPDVAYDMPNNDNTAKARLRPPTSYTKNGTESD